MKCMTARDYEWLLVLLVLLGATSASVSLQTPAAMVTGRWRPLDEGAAGAIRGASGTCQVCSLFNNGTCAGRASCGECLQLMCNVQGVGTVACGCVGTWSGCTDPDDSYQECLWARFWWCGQNGAARCGNAESKQCNHTGPVCTGGCTLVPDTSPCMQDCT